jgi:hypothetical protein
LATGERGSCHGYLGSLSKWDGNQSSWNNID